MQNVGCIDVEILDKIHKDMKYEAHLTYITQNCSFKRSKENIIQGAAHIQNSNIKVRLLTIFHERS